MRREHAVDSRSSAPPRLRGHRLGHNAGRTRRGARARRRSGHIHVGGGRGQSRTRRGARSRHSGADARAGARPHKRGNRSAHSRGGHARQVHCDGHDRIRAARLRARRTRRRHDRGQNGRVLGQTARRRSVRVPPQFPRTFSRHRRRAQHRARPHRLLLFLRRHAVRFCRFLRTLVRHNRSRRSAALSENGRQDGARGPYRRLCPHRLPGRPGRQRAYRKDSGRRVSVPHKPDRQAQRAQRRVCGRRGEGIRRRLRRDRKGAGGVPGHRQAHAARGLAGRSRGVFRLRAPSDRDTRRAGRARFGRV